MAAPKNRRPGFSRKAQYSLFVTYVLTISGAIIGALLLLISIIDPKGFSALRVAGAEISAPVNRFLSSIRRTFRDSGENISYYWDAASQNKAMDQKITKLENELNILQAAKLENKRLKSLMALNNDDSNKIIATGRLISTTASSGRRLAVISLPSTRNVKTGQPVRSNDGLIGRITEIGISTARILLLSDTDNVVPVIRLSDGLPAFSTGQADGSLLIKPLNLGENPFKIGDKLVTSGNGGLYPPNIPVAVIIDKVGESGKALPIADLGTANFVNILEIYEIDARNELIAIKEKVDSQEDNQP